MSKDVKTLYACGTDWHEEIGIVPDLDGRAPLFASLEALKARSLCWRECGIVRLNVELAEWVEAEKVHAK